MQPLPAPMARSTRRRATDPIVFSIIGGFVAFVVLNVAWFGASLSSEVLPHQGDVITAFPDIIEGDGPTEGLFSLVGTSVLNFLIAAVIGVVFGAALGAMSAAHPLLRGTIDPLSSVLRIASFIGLPHVLLIVRGFERSVQVIPPAVAIAATIALTLGRADGPGRSTVIVNGARSAVVFGWGALMAAELFGARSGLGQAVLRWSNFFRFDALVATALVAIAIPLVFDSVLRLIGHTLDEN